MPLQHASTLRMKTRWRRLSRVEKNNRVTATGMRIDPKATFKQRNSRFALSATALPGKVEGPIEDGPEVVVVPDDMSNS